MLLMLFGISVIIFAMLRIAPGNIADILFDAAGFVDPAEKAQIMKDLGLDQPLSGRCLPSAFGMYVRREGRGRYAPRWTRPCRSSSRGSRSTSSPPTSCHPRPARLCV